MNNLFFKKFYYICTQIHNNKQAMSRFYFTYSFYYFYFSKKVKQDFV
jgi:hypothetical protein